jgi:hypothetical protein
MKLGLLAPIDAEAEHAEAMLRNAAELAKQEQNTVTRLSFRENATTVGVFHTFADEQARRAHLEGRATDAIDRSGAKPTRYARREHAQSRAGFPCVWVAPRSRTTRLELRRRSLAVNAITTDEGLIEDLVYGPTVSNSYSGQHGTYEIAPEVPHNRFSADFLMRSIEMLRD